MKLTHKDRFLKYGIPAVAILVLLIQFLLVSTKNLSRWKGGGYGMYTEIHYFENKIYIPGSSVDTLLKNNLAMKKTLGKLMVMPNKKNLVTAGKLIMKTTCKDSIHIQVWRPNINSITGEFSRELIDEVHLKNSDF